VGRCLVHFAVDDHQRDAVRALVGDVAARGPGQRYLVEHSAGSGKSNTIAWLAWHLADLPDGSGGALFDKVVVVTDRTVLDNQLAETIEQMTAHPAKVRHIRERVREAQRARTALSGERTSGGSALADALEDPSVRVIIVTVQTFLKAPDALDDRARRSYAVILDEAHGGVGEKSDAAMARTLASDDGGDDYLRAYAARRQHPNQSLFAFTATPKRETLFLYGVHEPADDEPERRVPFHRYRMKQAIAEGFIVDVRDGYVRFNTYFKLRGVGLEGDDPEVDARLATPAIYREVFNDPKVMAQEGAG
jgi:type I restriction enzyme R subunit